jgi:elongation factor P--(R)-beta-lysine ligase
VSRANAVEKNWSLARRKNALRIRAGLIQAVRQYFCSRGYLEVETPHRIPAPAPESYIDAIPSGEWFLQTSPEISMKRLLAAGYEKIFQLCRCWRAEERGHLHLPEFTLLEWYRAGADYCGLMDETEDLIREIARSMATGDRLSFQGMEIDLTEAWERVPVEEAFRLYSSITPGEALSKGLFDEVMVRDIEPRLGNGRPSFLYDYPGARSALARLKSGRPDLAERFELYMAGLEIANAFSELVDPEKQRERFEIEADSRRALGKPAYPSPEKFLAELEGMPPSAGIALGIDRLVMIFSNSKTIDEVVAFTPEEL